MKKHSVTIRGHATSFSLEDEFWKAFCLLAQKRNETLKTLITHIDDNRRVNLSSAIRLFVLAELQKSGAEKPD